MITYVLSCCKFGFFLPGGSKGKIYNDKWQYDSLKSVIPWNVLINRKYFPVTDTHYFVIETYNTKSEESFENLKWKCTFSHFYFPLNFMTNHTETIVF